MTPLLLLLSGAPYLIRSIRNSNSQEFLEQYRLQLDSLNEAQVALINSPKSLFNPSDTVSKPKTVRKSDDLIKIDFAEADSIVLQIVPGIGTGLSGRIIKYREQLGGFHSQSQLGEIYGLKPETIEEIWNYFEFSPAISRRILINSVEMEELSAHPYISYGESKVLIAYRNQHGKFESIEDLKKIKIFKPEWVVKISPYISFD